MNRKRLVDFLVYLVIRIIICLAQTLRLETGQTITRFLAWIFCDVLKIRSGVLDDNLVHAFPELSAPARKRLERQMWEHLFLLVLEVANTPRKIHETNWRDFVELTNEDRLVRLLFENRPLLIVTGHLGNFEVGGYVLGILDFPTYTVARTLDNIYLDRFVNQFRGKTGQHIIPKNGGAEQIEKVLSNNGTMTFLADQCAGPKGCWVDFFGRPASAYKAVALLALEYHAVMAVSASNPPAQAHALPSTQLRHGRSAGRQRRGKRPRSIDPMVHHVPGRTHSPYSGTILVGPPALEGHPGTKTEKTAGGVKKNEG